LLLAKRAVISRNLVNYGEKEYTIKCKNIEVKCVGYYSLQILIGTECDQRYGLNKNIEPKYTPNACMCVYVCVCKVRQHANILQLINLKYALLKTLFVS